MITFARSAEETPPPGYYYSDKKAGKRDEKKKAGKEKGGGSESCKLFTGYMNASNCICRANSCLQDLRGGSLGLGLGNAFAEKMAACRICAGAAHSCVAYLPCRGAWDILLI